MRAGKGVDGLKRKSKAQLAAERAEKERQREQKELQKQAKAARDAQKRKEALHREWLRKERSKPREEMLAEYGESIHVHKRVLDAFMKQLGKKIDISSSKVVGGAGGSYILEYTTKHSGHGKLELFDLGPMPKG